jgi:hypothetical protein
MTKNGEPSRKGMMPAKPRASSISFHGEPVRRDVPAKIFFGSSLRFQ